MQASLHGRALAGVFRSTSTSGRRLPLPMPARPVLVFRSRDAIVAQAAAAAGDSSDPYKVLGVAPDADQNTIARAYRQKQVLARNSRDKEEAARIEAAHSQLMLRALSSRMKGQGVNKATRYADREPLFPWKPKRWDATPKVIAIIGALQLAMMAYGFQAPNMSKVVGSMLIGIAGNVLKQNAISPPPKDANTATEEEQGRSGRNFLRGALLGLLATFGGVLLLSFPEYLVQWFKVPLPPALTAAGLAVSLKIAGAAVSNWLMTAFYY